MITVPEKGFFSPFGFIPENIVSLSPVVYENEPKKERVFQTYQKCFPLKNNYNNFKKSYFKDYFNECSLNKKVDDNLLSNQLIKRYYK